MKPVRRVEGNPMTRSEEARWNEEMTRILREAAETRAQLDRTRSTEDNRLARQQSEACLALIDGVASSLDRRSRAS